MAWNEPGGKRRDPWESSEPQKPSSGGGSGGGDWRRWLPGGGSGGSFPGGAIWGVAGALLVLLLLADSVRAIDAKERGVVLRFGKVHRVMDSGLHFKLPRPFERVLVVETTKVRSSSSEVRMLTKDENLIVVDFNVQYVVNNPYRFLFGSRDPEDSLREAGEAAVRQIVGANKLDTIISPRRRVMEDNAKVVMQRLLDRYRTGLSVTELNFPNPRPPPEVKEAFDDAIAAREDRERFQNVADAYARKVVPEARGAAAKIRVGAEGQAAARVALAEGAASHFSQIAEAYGAAPDLTRKRLLLETMEDIYRRTPKVMVDAKGGDRLLYLPLDRMLERKASEASGVETQIDTVPVQPATGGSTATTRATRGQSAPEDVGETSDREARSR